MNIRESTPPMGASRRSNGLSFGQILKAARLDACLSLREAGERLTPPLSSAYLCDIESGRRSISPERLRQLLPLFSLSEKEERGMWELYGGAAELAYAVRAEMPNLKACAPASARRLERVLKRVSA